MPPQPRPELQTVRLATHGGFHADEWNTLGRVIDFSSNINPFGASPRVREAMANVPIERHPDPDAAELRDAIATRVNVSPDQVIVGNGSLDLIRALAVAYIRTGDTGLIVAPTFGEYRVAVEVMGARVIEFRAHARDEFRVDVDALIARVAELKPRLAFICNPNNPTGAYVSRDDSARVLDASPETLWMLDEAFVPFIENAWASRDLLARENLIVMRSMTKEYALPGLRLGYALAPREVIDALAKVRAPWSVNAFAQAAGLAVLADEKFLQDTLTQIRDEAKKLRAAIENLGWRVMPSALHYFLVEVGDARAFRATLAARGLLVRDCVSFGLPAFVRIATRKPEENAKLIKVLRELMRDA